MWSHPRDELGEDPVGVAVERWAIDGEEGGEFLIGSSGAEIAPGVDQVGFVAFTNQCGTSEWPGNELEPGQRTDQAQGVLGVRLIADARARAALDLVTEARFAGGCLFQSEQYVAQFVLCLLYTSPSPRD